MNHDAVSIAMQHTPLPERMGDFERTRSPKEPAALEGGAWLIVEYKHLSENILFQVILQGDDAQFQIMREGSADVLQTMTLQEAGHTLRRDLLMILEEIEDEL